MTSVSTASAAQIRANARCPGLPESAATTTRPARSHSGRLIAASASSCAAAPCVTSKATTPSTATSTVICPSTPSASGPTSSYDWARATPPVSPTASPGATGSATAVAMRCFSEACRAVLQRSGSSYDTPCTAAPSRTSICSASARRSRGGS